ncbi:hypothetical protein HDE_08786 [Halotydeus destructor]|nr:hypothetical protein HDE_08786 [Halotydeus destructor]
MSRNCPHDVEPRHHIGCKWTILTTDGEVVGILQNYDDRATAHAYVLDNVYIDGEFEGKLTIYKSEVLRAKISDHRSEGFKRNLSIKERELRYYSNDKEVNEQELKFPISDDEESQSENGLDEADIELWNIDGLEKANRTKYIENVNELRIFTEKLSQFELIGLAAFGENISRHGAIEFMALCCGDGCIYFKWTETNLQVVKDLLEHEYILKVCEDCRFIADALRKPITVRTIVNLRSVANFRSLEELLHERNEPKRRQKITFRRKPYEDLLYEYLDIDLNADHFQKAEIYKILRKFPQSNASKNYIKLNCSLLPYIYEEMLVQYNQPLIDKDDQILNYFKNALEPEYPSLARIAIQNAPENTRFVKLKAKDKKNEALLLSGNSDGVSSPSETASSLGSTASSISFEFLNSPIVIEKPKLPVKNLKPKIADDNLWPEPNANTPKIRFVAGGHEHHYLPSPRVVSCSNPILHARRQLDSICSNDSL